MNTLSRIAATAVLLASVSTYALAEQRTDLVRGFYFTSYGQNDLANKQNANRLDTYRKQLPNATHAIAAVHVRVPGGTKSNKVVRDEISENPDHLSKWFDIAKKNGLKVGMIIILFTNDWDWGGEWDPSNTKEALSSYYNAIQPYLKSAETAKTDFVIIADEWSTLFMKKSGVDAFKSLVSNARKDYNAGWIGINVNKLEEATLLPEIASSLDVIGITAYVPLSDKDKPSYDEMFNNLVKPSAVKDVRNAVKEGLTTVLKRKDEPGYMEYLQAMSAKWGKPILLTTGYKSTKGAAKDPADQPETSVDETVQSDAWRAFIDAALDPKHGAGSTLYGILGWRTWPAAADDDGKTGFNVINKPAAGVIDKAWAGKDNGDQPPTDDGNLNDEVKKCLDGPSDQLRDCILKLLERFQ